MTVVIVGHKGLPARSGGIERHVSLLAAGLASRGHKVVSYGRAWYVADGQPPAGVIQKITPGIRTKHWDAMTHTLTALWAARKDKPDVVHIQGSGVEILTPLARLLFPKAKIVYTVNCRNYDLKKWNRLVRWCLKLSERVGCLFAHRTIAVSQTLTKQCLEAYGCQAAYIPYSMPMPSEIPSPEYLSKYHLRREEYLLFVGRLIPDKQAHVLMEAYRLAREKRPELFKDVSVVFAGGGAWTNTYVKWLSQLAASVPGVHLLGERTGEELKSLQAHALGHIFPTLSEGMSLAILEACAYSRPTVCTNLPQNREATGGHGIEVRLNDVKDLARGLIELMEMSAEDRRKMGENAAIHVRRLCHLEDRTDDVLRLYHEVVTGESVLTSPLTTIPAATS
jgi:glycosyltransferase involved in cell wall biosynthesis